MRFTLFLFLIAVCTGCLGSALEPRETQTHFYTIDRALLSAATADTQIAPAVRPVELSAVNGDFSTKIQWSDAQDGEVYFSDTQYWAKLPAEMVYDALLLAGASVKTDPALTPWDAEAELFLFEYNPERRTAALGVRWQIRNPAKVKNGAYEILSQTTRIFREKGKNPGDAMGKCMKKFAEAYCKLPVDAADTTHPESAK